MPQSPVRNENGQTGDLVDLFDRDTSRLSLSLRLAISHTYLTEDDTSRKLGRRVFRNVRLDDKDPHRSSCFGRDISVRLLDQHDVRCEVGAVSGMGSLSVFMIRLA